MRNNCSLSGGWCLKALTRGEYINSRMLIVELYCVWWSCQAVVLTQGVESRLETGRNLFEHRVFLTELKYSRFAQGRWQTRELPGVI